MAGISAMSDRRPEDASSSRLVALPQRAHLAPFYVNEGSFPPVDVAPVLAVVKQTALDDGCGPALFRGVGNGPENGLAWSFSRG